MYSYHRNISNDYPETYMYVFGGTAYAPGSPGFDCTHSSATIKLGKQKNSILVCQNLSIFVWSVKTSDFRRWQDYVCGHLSLCLSPLSPLSHVLVHLSYLYLLYHLHQIRLSVALGPAVFPGYSYIRGRSMLRTGHATCNLCGSKIHSFAATQISEIIYRDKPQDLNIFPPHNSWICGRPADLEDIHFDEMWTWSCTFRAGKCCFKHPD